MSNLNLTQMMELQKMFDNQANMNSGMIESFNNMIQSKHIKKLLSVMLIDNHIN